MTEDQESLSQRGLSFNYEHMAQAPNLGSDTRTDGEDDGVTPALLRNDQD